MNKKVKIILILMLVILVPLLTYNAMIKLVSSDILYTEDTTENAVEEVEQPQQSVFENVKDFLLPTRQIDDIVFVLAGIDTEGGNSEKGDTLRGVRSDTMLLVKANFVTGKVDIVSLPRDSRVPIKGKLDKLTHAHSYGGVELMMETIREFTGVKVDKFVRVDYRAVKTIVDAIGGIEINITEPMEYHDTTTGKELHISFQPGVQTLDGQASMEYLRYRSYQEGDIQRVKNQQYFLTEFIKQTIAKVGITNIGSIITTYFNNVYTNIPMRDMLDLGLMLDKVDLNGIETNTLPGQGQYIDNISYFVLDEYETRQMLERLFGEYMEVQPQ